MYLNDSGDYFIPWRQGSAAAYEYWPWIFHKGNYQPNPKLWICPTAGKLLDVAYVTGVNGILGNPKSQTRYTYSCYGYNKDYLGTNPGTASDTDLATTKVGLVKVPSKKVMFADSYSSSNMRPTCAVTPSSVLPNSYALDARHQMFSANIIWVDGHVSNVASARSRIVSSDGTATAYWDPASNTTYLNRDIQ